MANNVLPVAVADLPAIMLQLPIEVTQPQAGMTFAYTTADQTMGVLSVPDGILGAVRAAMSSASIAAAKVNALLAYASDHQNNLLAQTWAFNVGTPSAPIWLTTKLDDKGRASMTDLLVWASVALSTDTESYSNVDYSSVKISAVQARTLGLAASAARSATYAVLSAVTAAIKASPPTITTQAEVNAACWPVPTAVS